MPRARYSDFYPPQSYRTATSSYDAADVSPGILFSLIGAGILLLYNILHAPLRLPPLTEIAFMMIGAVLGPGVRETLQNAFSAGGRSVAERVRNRAASLVGVLPGAYGTGGVFVGGLWNTGNTCYQNSVLQAMASLGHLKPHLASLAQEHEEEEDMELNPSGALMALITALNTLTPNPRASAPSPVIVRGTDNSGWVYNEQQDAQEFFQKLTGSLEKEASRFLEDCKRRIQRGLENAVELQGEQKIYEHPQLSEALAKPYRSPFEGLFAQRVGCLKCGYVESISLQPFTSLSLPLPPSWSCSLEECLADFTELEQIPEVDCDKCTLLTLHTQLLALSSQPSLPPALSSQLLPRIAALEAALENDDFSPNIPGVKISARQKVSSTKTKQTMIARPPPVLVLHMNRSQYDVITGVAGKNFSAVMFPARVDLARLGVITRHDVEDGSWGLGVEPGKRMSGRIPKWFNRAEGSEEEDLDTDAEEEKREKYRRAAKVEPNAQSVLYDLKSVVAHYGGHHNGHYVCYRKVGKQWFKISDHEVYACDEEDALNAGNAFMLFYERVIAEDKVNGANGANGSAMGNGHAISEEDSLASATDDSEDGTLAEDDDGDDLTLLDDSAGENGDANGNWNKTSLKQLEHEGIRRRKEEDAEEVIVDGVR